MWQRLGFQRFNSKLVRLEVTRSRKLPSLCRLFQFQTGSIRRTLKTTIHLPPRMFQFQTGSIRSEPDPEADLGTGQSFNSKLVRLEVKIDGLHDDIVELSFNSKLVRLEACIRTGT